MDLRREKCFSRIRITNGVEGIYTGYSANGSHCFVPVLNGVSKDFATVVGHVFGYGFPISNGLELPPCGEEWDILVEKKSSSTGNFCIRINQTRARAPRLRS